MTPRAALVLLAGAVFLAVFALGTWWMVQNRSLLTEATLALDVDQREGPPR